MPSLLNLLPLAVGQSGAAIIYAEVTTPAPTSFADSLFVVMPDWSRDFPFELTDWPAVHGQTLPLAGDVALLVKDSRGTTRCIGWNGQMTFATQQSRHYYLTTTGSDIASRTALSEAPPNVETSVPFTSVANGTTLTNFVSPPGTPGTGFLPAGQYELHVHAQQTGGNQSVQIYAEIWEYDPIGATDVAKLGTTQVSEKLTLEEVEYSLFFELSQSYTLVSQQSRISARVNALVGGAGGANLAYFVGGAADSHVVIPVGNVAPEKAPNYTLATRPAASSVLPGTIIFVSDGGAGAVFQGSTGSAWVNLG